MKTITMDYDEYLREKEELEENLVATYEQVVKEALSSERRNGTADAIEAIVHVLLGGDPNTVLKLDYANTENLKYVLSALLTAIVASQQQTKKEEVKDETNLLSQ